MKTLGEQLANYAGYHRNPRNIATHFIGIPMIVIAIAALLSRPVFEFMGMPLSPAVLVVMLCVGYYLRLDIFYGVVMGLAMGGALWIGHEMAAGSTASWLCWGLGLFVGGWFIQFVGHYFEGKKPAFVDDLMGLIIGPLFVVAKMLFAIGVRKEVQLDIDNRLAKSR